MRNRAEPPVDRKRRRQEHNDRHDRGKMLAEERQPHAEHARGAFDHHLEQTPGVGARMEAHRQMQHVFEKGGHDRDAVAVRKPVGVQRNGYAGDDAKDAERRPGRERRPYAAPLQRGARPLGMRKLIDHLAEKKRLGELRHGERDIGEDQRSSQPFLSCEQT